MYGGHVEPDFVLQNSRCWQVILTFEEVNITTNIVKWPGRSIHYKQWQGCFNAAISRNTGYSDTGKNFIFAALTSQHDIKLQ